LAALLFLAPVAGCARRPRGDTDPVTADPNAEPTSEEVEAEVKAARDAASTQMSYIRELFEDGHFYDVTLEVRNFVKVHPGSRYLDEAWFLLARAEYEEGNFLDAEDRFRRILRDFPQSDYARDSLYYLGLALLSQSRKAELDQTETEAAQVQFRSFLTRYPDNELAPRAEEHIRTIREKLAEKTYKNGETYRKIKSWSAARYYYEQTYLDFRNTSWAPRAGLRMAETYRKGKPRNWNDVARWSARVVADFPDTPEGVSAQKLLDEATHEMELEDERLRNPGVDPDDEPEAGAPR